MLCLVRAKQQMTLSYISTVFLGFNFALSHHAQVMLRELALVARLVVDLCATELILWNSVSHYSGLLVEDLRAMHLVNVVSVGLLGEELVVLIRSCAIVNFLFEAHAEVCHTHAIGITHLCHILVLELLRGVGIARRRLILKFGRSV